MNKPLDEKCLILLLQRWVQEQRSYIVYELALIIQIRIFFTHDTFCLACEQIITILRHKKFDTAYKGLLILHKSQAVRTK